MSTAISHRLSLEEGLTLVETVLLLRAGPPGEGLSWEISQAANTPIAGGVCYNPGGREPGQGTMASTYDRPDGGEEGRHLREEHYRQREQQELAWRV